jgi:separase
VLHEYESATKQSASGAGEDVFLVLDKNVQGIPWESIPALRGRPISRVPSLDFLVDRATGEIDASKVFYILNPSGDLLRTQEHFESWLKKKGWKGITGETPTEEALVKALTENDLVL